MKSCSVFVDVNNQFYSTTHKRQGARIDYAKYLAKATQDFELYRAFAYGAQMRDEANAFIDCLRSIGFETRYRPALKIEDHFDIRRTDRKMMLIMDVWRVIEKTDVVILGSNDPELIPLVERIQELGRQVIVYSCNISRELRNTANRSIELDETIFEYRQQQQAAQESVTTES